MPANRKALSTKWVWKSKRSPSGTIERFKARWVARGDLQKKGIDYKETFAPVAMLVSLRILLTCVVLLDLELDQLDVVGAFLRHTNTVAERLFPAGVRHPGGETGLGTVYRGVGGVV